MRTVAFIAFTACLLPASLPAAQATGDGVPDSARSYMQRMDADGDGLVSLPEYQGWMGYGFAAMDRDHDGILSTSELPGGRGRPLTRAAHRERLAAGFHRQDRNGDGRLDAGELAAPPR